MKLTMSSTAAAVSDDLVTCPYQPNHKVARRRFIQHITKCEKDPKSPRLEKCIYNQQHRIAPELMAVHLKECRDSANVFKEMWYSAEEKVDKNLDSFGSGEEVKSSDYDPWGEAPDRQSFSLSDSWSCSTRNPLRSDGTLNPLIYQTLTPAERRQINQSSFDRPGNLNLPNSSKPKPVGIGRGRR